MSGVSRRHTPRPGAIQGAVRCGRSQAAGLSRRAARVVLRAPATDAVAQADATVMRIVFIGSPGEFGGLPTGDPERAREPEPRGPRHARQDRPLLRAASPSRAGHVPRRPAIVQKSRSATSQAARCRSSNEGPPTPSRTGGLSRPGGASTTSTRSAGPRPGSGFANRPPGTSPDAQAAGRGHFATNVAHRRRVQGRSHLLRQRRSRSAGQRRPGRPGDPGRPHAGDDGAASKDCRGGACSRRGRTSRRS